MTPTTWPRSSLTASPPSCRPRWMRLRVASPRAPMTLPMVPGKRFASAVRCLAWTWAMAAVFCYRAAHQLVSFFFALPIKLAYSRGASSRTPRALVLTVLRRLTAFGSFALRFATSTGSFGLTFGSGTTGGGGGGGGGGGVGTFGVKNPITSSSLVGCTYCRP